MPKILETKQQKKYFTTTIVLVIILSLVTFWNRGNYNLAAVQKPIVGDGFDYKAYLASLKIDEAASEQLFKELVSEEEVKKEVENALQVNQKIITPEIDEKKLAVVNISDSQSIVNYVKKSLELTDQLGFYAQPVTDYLFDTSTGVEKVDKLINDTKGIIDQYYTTPVPKEAVGMHESQLVTLETFMSFLKTSKAYQSTPDVDPWPKVYHDHVVIDKSMGNFQDEYRKLDEKYAISDQLQKDLGTVAHGNWLVKSANAQFGGLVVDVFQKAESVLRAALSTAYITFMTRFIDKLLDKLENDYRIANFLYYTDAVVSGQYVDDYLTKYVGNSLDKAVIKNFIPQISCGNKQDFATFFRAKAEQNIGFDPATVSPNDPDYYAKMSKVGNFLSSGSGWKLYYQDVAEQAQAAARQATEDELQSSGLKVPRELNSKGIIRTQDILKATKAGAIQSKITLGHSSSGSTAANIAKAATETFINAFVFKGAVLKEQAVCITAPQVSPIVPSAATPDPGVPATPSETDIRNQYRIP